MFVNDHPQRAELVPRHGLEDKFGPAWQIVPGRIMELISSPKGMAAMMTMKKLDIAALEEANRP